MLFNIKPYIESGIFPPLVTSDVLKNKIKCEEQHITNYYFIHLEEVKMNLCSNNQLIRNYSILSLVAESNLLLERNFNNITLHPGSTKGIISFEEGINNLILSLKIVIKETNYKMKFIVENMTGGNKLLKTNEEMLYFIEKCKEQNIWNYIKLCWDTCHFFASGYDLNNLNHPEWPFCKYIDEVEVIHLNNSKFPLNKGVDNHSYWCTCNPGYINLETARKLYTIFKNKKILILETHQNHLSFEEQSLLIEQQDLQECICKKELN